MATMHELLIRDKDRNILGPLTRWDDGDLTLRFNAPGRGTLVVHPDEPWLPYLQDGGGFVLVRDDGINRTVLASGAVVDESETADAFTFEVEDDTTILADTVALPVPSESGPTYSAEFDTRTGLASTIIYQYVYYNAGPGARSDRVRPGFALAADPLTGDTITGRGRFHALDELFRELALAGGGFRFWCDQTLGASTIVFRISLPTDRSSAVRFTREQGALGPYERRTTAGGPNYVFAGAGDGLGADRSVYELGDSASIAQYGRRETFLDTRGETSASEVYQRIAETLANSSQQTSLTVEPSEYVPFVYGRDYQLGDIVGTEFGPASVREVRLQIDAKGGLTATPVIGTVGSSGDDASSRQYAAVERRLGNIERNTGIPDNSITNAMLRTTERWYVGDLRTTLRSTAAPGWLVCNGAAVSRTTYADLFEELGTTYGVGDGSTTFNLPDLSAKYLRGAGGGVGVGESGGSATADVPAHSHPHSHGGGSLAYSHSHNGQAHTHPGSHSHGAGTITYQHDHTVDINHDHPAFDSGGANTDTVAIGRDEPGSGAEDHHHSINVPALGTTNKTSSNANNVSRSGSTDPDSNAPAASYSGSPSGVNAGASWSGGTDQDSTSASGSTVDIEPPFFGVQVEIYSGVAA
ncbi:MAG: tail fiber protein [Chloroflexota bacterium]